MQEIYRFIKFLKTELLLFIKQCPLDFYGWELTKVGAIIVWCSYIFNTFFSRFFRFSSINLSGATKKLKKFISYINTKYCCNTLEEKYLRMLLYYYIFKYTLRILCPLIKSLVNSFIDISSTFPDTSSTITFIIFWDVLMFYQVFPSPPVKRCTIITYKHGIHEFPYELPNDVRLRTLGN